MSISIVTQPNKTPNSTIYTQLANGSFESGTISSLAYVGNVTAVLSTAMAYNGVKSLLVQAGDGFNNFDDSSFTIPFTPIANQNYYISCYVYMPLISTNDSPLIEMTLANFTDATIIKSENYALEGNFDSWYKLYLEVRIGTDVSGKIQFNLFTGDASYFEFYLDNITAVAIEPVLLVYNPIWYQSLSQLYTVAGFKYLYTLSDLTGEIAKSRVIPSVSTYGEYDASTIARNRLSFDLNYNISDFANAYNSSKSLLVTAQEEVYGAIVASITNSPLTLTFATPFVCAELANGAKITGLNLPGVTTTAATTYYVGTITRNGSQEVTSFRVYTNSILTTSAVATGTFSANGYVQVENNLIPFQTSSTVAAKAVQVINAVQSYSEVLNWNGGLDYILDTPGKSFLNKFPTYIRQIKLDQYETLSFLAADYNMPYKFTVTQYNSANSVIDMDDHLFALSPAPENLRLDIGIGTKNLNIGSSTGSYKIQIYNASGTQLGNTITYQVVGNCDVNNTRLMWLNDLGVFEFYDFRMIKHGLAIEKKSYTSNLPVSYVTSDRGESVYHSQNQASRELITDFLNDSEIEYIKSLFVSPVVFRFDSSNNLIPVVMTAEQFRYKRPGYDRVHQYRFEIKDANKNIANY